jgi:hypothetical protein
VTGDDGHVVQGSLECHDCDRRWPIEGGIPRFVPLDNYSETFGFQWNMHDRTQYDQTSGAGASSVRFAEETRWGTSLKGEVIIEAGGGSGRFTPHALATGAVVLSLDYSSAVEANYRSNHEHANLLVVQASI